MGTLYLESPLNRRWPDAVTTLGAADDVVVEPWTTPLPLWSPSDSRSLDHVTLKSMQIDR